VTGIAGYSGLVLGVAILEGVSALLTKMNVELPFFRQPEIDMGVAVSSLLLLISAGVIAGLMPALRAARITPTEAMKAE
jgi:putative ABC transport system permease protein